MKEPAFSTDFSKHDACEECVREVLEWNYEDNSSCDQQTSSIDIRIYTTLREVIECKAYSQLFLCIWLYVLCFHAKPLAKKIWQELYLLYLCCVWWPKEMMDVLRSYQWTVLYNTKCGIWLSILVVVFRKRRANRLKKNWRSN